MVVRSNGCFACKRRRIKCDQARPQCRRCKIHRIQCPGYPSDTDNPINIVVYGSTNSSPGSDSLGTLPLQINAVAQRRIQMIASASSKFVPIGEKPLVPLDLMDIAGFNAIHIRRPALEAAVDALALVQLGTTSKDPELLNNAGHAYGQSLRLLSEYIQKGQRSSRVWDDQMASAIVLLKYCESFEPLHYTKGSSIHHIGLRSFYLNRGPVPLKDAAESILFCQARVIIFGGSLHQRQKCFLEEPKWLEISRTAPGRDRFWDLQDLSVRLPGLAELADRGIQRSDENSIKDTMSEFEGFIQDLDNFALDLCPTIFDPAQVSHDPTWLSPEPTIGNPHSFTSWRSTNMYCAWTVIRLKALLELQQLHIHLSLIPPFSNTGREGLEAEIDSTIENMCKAIPPQLGKQQHSLGIICSMQMLPAAAALLRERGRLVEANWCQYILERLKSEGFR